MDAGWSPAADEASIMLQQQLDDEVEQLCKLAGADLDAAEISSVCHQQVQLPVRLPLAAATAPHLDQLPPPLECARVLTPWEVPGLLQPPAEGSPGLAGAHPQQGWMYMEWDASPAAGSQAEGPVVAPAAAPWGHPERAVQLATDLLPLRHAAAAAPVVGPALTCVSDLSSSGVPQAAAEQAIPAAAMMQLQQQQQELHEEEQHEQQQQRPEQQEQEVPGQGSRGAKLAHRALQPAAQDAPPRQQTMHGQRRARLSTAHGSGQSRLQGTVPRRQGPPALRVQQQRDSTARYHARQRAGMAALEAEVASKAAQVAALEAQRGALAQRTHVLETMVADTGKLLQVLSGNRPPAPGVPEQQHLPGLVASSMQQQPGSSGVAPTASSATPRPLHLMLDTGAAANPAAWSLGQALQRWKEYVAAARPLLQAVAFARARHAKQAAVEEHTMDGVRRRPRRAATAALSRMSALVQQLEQGEAAGPSTAAATGGMLPGLPPNRPDSSSVSSHDTLSCCWPPAGEVHGQVVYGGPGTEGVPLELLAQVEHLVLDNMAWLHALATSTALHKHHFFAADFEGRGRLAPQPKDPFWQRVVAAMSLTHAQQQQCATTLAAANGRREAVCLERGGLQAVLAAHMDAAGLDALARCTALEAAAAAAAGMERSLAREHITRHLVGMAQSNVLSLLQQAQAAVAAWPWFPGSWSVFQAAAAGLQEGQDWLALF